MSISNPPTHQANVCTAVTLPELMRRRMGELNMTVVDVAKRASCSPSTLYAVLGRKKPRTPPRPATLVAIAKGLDLPLDVVRAAAAASAGFSGAAEISMDDEDVAVVVDAMGQMTASQRGFLRQVALVVLEELTRER